jgi:hypothetical protein
MNGYVTYADLVWIIIAFVIGDVLAHVGSDIAKLWWQRRKARTR